MPNLSSTAAIHYLGRTQSHEDVNLQADAFAEYLVEAGVAQGDRVLLQLQNMPQALIAFKAAWRLGAIAVPVNPMYKSQELGRLIADCRPKVALVLDDLYASVLKPVLPQFGDLTVVTTATSDYAAPEVAEELGLVPKPCPDTESFVDIVSRSTSHTPMTFHRADRGKDDVAALIYTSGTTGPSKGAMITHGNLTAEVQLWKDVYRFERGDAIMGVAPIFHITGLVADLVMSMDCQVPLVHMYRFDPAWALRWIEEYRPTSMVVAITVYTALLSHPSMSAQGVHSLRTCLSGGAPVSPSTVRWWRETTGGYIRNCYGLTETSSLVTLTPAHHEAPVDPGTGALSVGQAGKGTAISIRDTDDAALGNNEIGEIVISGPQVAAGYWENPTETASAFRNGALHTGDVGFLDDDGWLYLIDRSKDLIVTSGYKVWPREVEDLLLQHPAVAEASVVGVPDDYRGEQVAAFVTLRTGFATDEGQLIDFCRDRVAVYKVPRRVTFLAELPKTASGKILRRELRRQS